MSHETDRVASGSGPEAGDEALPANSTAATSAGVANDDDHDNYDDLERDSDSDRVRDSDSDRVRDSDSDSDADLVTGHDGHFGEAYQRYFGSPALGLIDKAEAQRSAQLAADDGHLGGKVLLGLCLVESGRLDDVERGFELIQAAVGAGSAFGTACLGTCYVGGRGVAQDPDMAAALFLAAAEQGDAFGLCGLGHCYMKGWGGVKDTWKATECYRQAAEKDLAEAQCYFAECLESGTGERYLDDPLDWYKRAAQQGYVPAQDKLRLLRPDAGASDSAADGLPAESPGRSPQ